MSRTAVGGGMARARLLAALGIAGLAFAAAPAHARVACRSGDPQPQRWEMGAGADATYWLVARPQRRPRGLVVLAHGYDDTAEDFQRHLPLLAARGLIAVAPNFRGTRNLPLAEGDEDPESRGLPVRAGAEDVVAAGRLFVAACAGLRRTILAGFSAGGMVASVAESWAPKRPSGAPLFDHLVLLSPLADTFGPWLAAGVTGQVDPGVAQFRADLEDETGGTPVEVPDAYRTRSPLFQAGAIAASGLRSAAVIVPALDGTTPSPTILALASALRAAGLPTHTETIVTRDEHDPPPPTLLTTAGIDDPLFAGHDERVGSTTGRAFMRHIARVSRL